jgi:hypothetical protein
MISLDDIRKRAEKWLGPEFNEETSREVKWMLENDEMKLIYSFYQDL